MMLSIQLTLVFNMGLIFLKWLSNIFAADMGGSQRRLKRSIFLTAVLMRSSISGRRGEKTKGSAVLTHLTSGLLEVWSYSWLVFSEGRQKRKAEITVIFKPAFGVSQPLPELFNQNNRSMNRETETVKTRFYCYSFMSSATLFYF